MTSEVALLNRSAVALAADSAATVSHWEKDHFETRYFKGNNKIFHLSASEPVGIMIYAAANMQGAPWEVLIKSYRDQLGAKSHDELPAYADDFFSYITNNTHIFSAAFQEKQFQADANVVAARILYPIIRSDPFKNAQDQAAKATAIKDGLTVAAPKIEGAMFVGSAVQADVDAALAKYVNVIASAIEQDTAFSAFNGLVDFGELARLAIVGQYKVGHTNLSSSGIVVTGFGVKDFFPRLVAYKCHGLVLGKLLLTEEKQKALSIDQSNSSAFVSFAQDEMIRTFVFGTSASAMVEADSQCERAIDDFYNELVGRGLAPDVSADPAKMTELQALKTEMVNAFGSGIIDYSHDTHSRPMRRVLSALPIDELAELAETLVLLESLKERVTSPSSSVSGPIDVAVISKNDGFIWIKRKHYFDPKLNPRFFSRRGLGGGA